jgi:hypothetical protein
MQLPHAITYLDVLKMTWMHIWCPQCISILEWPWSLDNSTSYIQLVVKQIIKAFSFKNNRFDCFLSFMVLCRVLSLDWRHYKGSDPPPSHSKNDVSQAREHDVNRSGAPTCSSEFNLDSFAITVTSRKTTSRTLCKGKTHCIALDIKRWCAFSSQTNGHDYFMRTRQDNLRCS